MGATNKLKPEWETELRLDAWQRLFCAIMARARADLHSRHAALRQEVRDWLDTEDFIDLCELANLAPAGIRQRLHRPPIPVYHANLALSHHPAKLNKGME
jgi:hypothetical protein